MPNVSAISLPDACSHPLPQSPDLLIVGGGVVGLWCAVRAAQHGLSAVLAEKGRIGQGASGGFLGALVPHQPVNWTAKKAFQLEALMTLETEVAALHEATGLSCGYHRCGRLMPIQTPGKLRESRAWQTASRENWPKVSTSAAAIGWDLLQRPPDPRWFSSALAPLGCDFETLSARIDPRALLQALVGKAAPDVHIRENCCVQSISREGNAVLGDKTVLSPGHVIVAAGHETFGLLKPLTGRALGSGVPGQAALLKPREPVPADQPIAYRGGLYVICHDNGLLAVGSTSDTSFDDMRAMKGSLDDLIERAVELCPSLNGATLVERWAGIRPRAVGREPIVGPVPDAPRVIVASGGFKITFGIAHRMADAALGFITGTKVDLPSSFTVEYHYACTPRTRQGRQRKA